MIWGLFWLLIVPIKVWILFYVLMWVYKIFLGVI